MNHGDPDFPINPQEKDQMLDELESLSRMLDDDDLDDDDLDDGHRIQISQDIPVLKSFVDDVPLLSDGLEEFVDDIDHDDIDHAEAPNQPAAIAAATAPDTAKTSAQAVPEPDNKAAPQPAAERPAVMPSQMPEHLPEDVPEKSSALDVSFLDQDPLDISARVREYHRQSAPPPIRQQDPSHAITQEALLKAAQLNTQPEPPALPPMVDPAPAASASPQENLAATPSVTAVPMAPPERSENPFLPRATLDKIRQNHAWLQSQEQENDASAQLRKLLRDNPLNKTNFEPSSKEAQALRQKASQLVDEVVRANLHRLEAELRMKLEQEVDRMFKEAKKNPG